MNVHGSVVVGRALALVGCFSLMTACANEDSSGPSPVVHEDLGMGDGSDVVTIGDSWMNLIISGIEQSLDAASGQNYRNYGVPGTRVLNGQIPGQYASAVSANPDIKTVVATGGGNDILASPCVDEECFAVVDEVSVAIQALSAQLADDGVQDVIIIGYTYPDDVTKRASIDYTIGNITDTCMLDATPRCHFVDSTQLGITLRDGIHPDDAGYNLIGETVWALMQAQGIRR